MSYTTRATTKGGREGRAVLEDGKLALAMALSMGDLGVIALFGGDRLVTLPYLVQARMGSYRTQDAEGLALMLAVICLLLTLAAVQASKETPA